MHHLGAMGWMKIYVIEAVPFADQASVGRKWRHKHRHHPVIDAATSYYSHHECLRARDFTAQLDAFLNEQSAMVCAEGERIVLWLSIHGAPTKKSIRFGNGYYMSYWRSLGRLHKTLRPNVVVLQSICWGGFPTGVTRFMNKSTRGPSLAFGPTIAANVTALHHAEREVLKFLAHHDGTPVGAVDVRSLVRSINSYGERTPYPEHNRFYRAWYFRRGKLKRYPGPTRQGVSG